MNILITGGTGLIGKALIPRLTEHNVTVLTRDVKRAGTILSNKVTLVESLALVDFSSIDIVINLAGEPIADKRWTPAQKSKICNSRWGITKELSNQILSADKAPHLYISGSAIGYYGRQNTQPIGEDFENINPEFTHTVCKQWEDEALKANSPATRVCLLRTGIVLDDKAGALAKMLLPFKLGLGGPVSHGNQIMSWIHITDMVNIILHCIDNDALAGSINATAPNPVSNEYFSKILSSTLNRPCVFRIPKPVLTFILGEMSDLLLYGQNVLPEKLLSQGFTFTYPHIDKAMEALILK